MSCSKWWTDSIIMIHDLHDSTFYCNFKQTMMNRSRENGAQTISRLNTYLQLNLLMETSYDSFCLSLFSVFTEQIVNGHIFIHMLLNTSLIQHHHLQVSCYLVLLLFMHKVYLSLSFSLHPASSRGAAGASCWLKGGGRVSAAHNTEAVKTVAEMIDQVKPWLINMNTCLRVCQRFCFF